MTTGEVPEGPAADVEDLIAVAEDVRALRFLVEPNIVVLNPAEFSARVRPMLAARVDEARDDALARLFSTLAVSGSEGDMTRLDLIGNPTTAWYDESGGSLLVADVAGGYGPAEKAEIVHEVVHALTDQHYRWSETRAELEGADDPLRAFDSLIEGDATYFELVYVQQLPQEEQESVARAVLDATDSEVRPVWLLRDAIFPFDEGFDFVADLVAGGGIAAVDRAYLDPPTTSEQILHPERYLRGEAGMDVGGDQAVLDGYSELSTTSFGELGLRLILEGSMSPGLLTQTADGWGGDAYQLFVGNGGEVAFSLRYLGDNESHTAEVTQAFINLAKDVVGVDDGERLGGGELYTRDGRPWIFLDRDGAGLLVIVASERSAGRSLADQLAPPS